MSAGTLDHMEPLASYDVPPALLEILRRCFARDPDERPTFQELCATLAKLADAEEEERRAAPRVRAPELAAMLDAYDENGPTTSASAVQMPARSTERQMSDALPVPSARASLTVSSTASASSLEDLENVPLPPLPVPAANAEGDE